VDVEGIIVVLDVDEMTVVDEVVVEVELDVEVLDPLLSVAFCGKRMNAETTAIIAIAATTSTRFRVEISFAS
jgi:hypothetical protein